MALHALFIAGWWPTQSKPYSGIFIREHAKALSAHCQVSVAHLRIHKRLGAFPYRIRIFRKIFPEFVEYRVEVSTAIRKWGVHDWLVRRAYRKVLRLIAHEHPVDVCHINVRTHLTKLATEVPEIAQLPLVVSEHFSFYHTGINQLPAAEQAVARNEVRAWFAQPNLRAVMPVSQQLAGVLSNDFGVPEDRISVVANVASEAFAYREVPPQDRINILLVANWQPPKNPMLFLQALRELPKEYQHRITIDWIGEGLQIEAIRAFVETNLREWDIRFHGFQPKSFIAERMQEASFLVHPSDAENLPTVIIESLCCGNPVLSHAINGIPELIHERNGLLARPKDQADFTARLTAMLQQYSSFDRPAIAREAQERFSAHAIGAAIFAQYPQP